MQEAGHILIIDDDLDYSCLLQVAFEEACVTNPTLIIHDGRSAVNYLKQMGTGGSDDADTVPALVLLDLRLPGLSGLEVLSWIRGEPRLAGIPVLVFTGMEGGEEPLRARELGAASLQLKPFSYRDLVQTVEAIRTHYLEPIELPKAA